MRPFRVNLFYRHDAVWRQRQFTGRLRQVHVRFASVGAEDFGVRRPDLYSLDVDGQTDLHYFDAKEEGCNCQGNKEEKLWDKSSFSNLLDKDKR